MDFNFPRRWIFLLVFFFLAVAFLVIHFTRGESFDATVEQIVLRGRSSKGSLLIPTSVQQLSVLFNGYEFFIGSRTPAQLILSDGIRHRLKLIDWAVNANNIVLTLRYGIILTFSMEAEKSAVSIQVDIPIQNIPTVNYLLLPLRLQEGYTADSNKESLVIQGPEDSFQITWPEDSQWDAVSELLHLKVNGAETLLLAENILDMNRLTFNEWYAEGDIPQESLFEQRLNTWLEIAVDGWKNRYDPNSGLWLDTNGGAAWDDSLTAGLLAMALENGEYPSQLSMTKTKAAQVPDQVGKLLSPYLGKIELAGEELIRELSQEANRIVGGLGNPEELLGRDLLPLLIDDGRIEEAGFLLETARDLSENNSPQAILFWLEILQGAQEFGLQVPEDSSLEERLINEGLLPHIIWQHGGLWFITEKNRVNMSDTLRTAKILLDSSPSSSQKLFSDTGRQLILSALDHANAQGELPEELVFRGSLIVPNKTWELRENFYHSLIPRKFFPRRISLFQEYGAGSWIWTAVEELAFKSTQQEITLSLNFPQGETHYLILHNIEPFTQIYLHDLSWTSNPQFQSQPEGWVYKSATKTLYVKLRHNNRQETVRILYYYPEQEVVVQEKDIEEENTPESNEESTEPEEANESEITEEPQGTEENNQAETENQDRSEYQRELNLESIQ